MSKLTKLLFLLGVVVAFSSNVLAATDMFSVNFYAYGSLNPADYDAVTLESGESAGFGSWNTTGWENYLVPWGLSSPANPVTITSVQAETATLTLNDVRNGGPYTGSPHSNLPGDGNGDLMDGHCNATEDPYDGSNLFDMTVSGIPYTIYDVIVYIGSNAAQFGDGKGKVIFNGGAEQDFTLPSGEFAAFAEIVNGTIPGNYIVFSGVRGTSFTMQLRGNGFNHIGPTGFQIVNDDSGVIPPGLATGPNPNDDAVGLPSNTDLSWTAGLDADSSDVYFGTDSTPDSGELQGNQTGSAFDPGALANDSYFWRIDGVNSDGTTTGLVWSFVVGPPASAFRPMPWDGMTAVALDAGLLSWVEGESASAVSSDVYFGTDPTPDAGEFVGNQTATTFDPGILSADTTYYWRIDMVNAQGTAAGDLWSFTTPKASANRVKVFILAGQSNMEGHGEMDPMGTQGTLEYLVANDPATYGHLKDGAGWAVRDDAWIWYKRGGTALVNGGLTAGYGAASTTVGPELQFGHAMGDLYDQKVLIIKTAWGGKSLRTDFRPPSSGWSLDTPITAGDEGFYYQEMLGFVIDAMANLPTFFPAYNPADGYEIAGFGWHQGWNDRVTTAFAAEYEVNMAHFINDVRASVGVPDLPFVIATTGMDGNPDYSAVELAQLAMADVVSYPEFEGNVAVIDTQDFWREVADSPANQGYHWNRNAETHFLIGQSMADGMMALLSSPEETTVSLVNVGATEIATNAATLNATLVCTGTHVAVSAYWNTVNDGTDPVLWTNSVYVGTYTNVATTNLSVTVTGLAPNTAHFFTFRATNATDSVWASGAPGFSTLALPTVPPAFSAFLSEDFEHEWADNALARATNHWTSSGLADLSSITNPAVGYGPLPLGVPFPLAYNHTLMRRVLKVNTGADTLSTPLLDAGFSDAKVYIDMTVKLDLREPIPDVGSVDVDAKTVLFLKADGGTTNLYVLHGQKMADGFGAPLFTGVGSTVAPGSWNRLTVVQDATTNGGGAEAFCVMINGQPVLSPAAYDEDWKNSIFTGSYAPDGGVWFLSAARRAGTSGTNLTSCSGLIFEGQGYVDDLVVTYDAPNFAGGTLLMVR